MIRSSLLSFLFRSASQLRVTQTRRSFKPTLEKLEDRWVPSTLHVGSGEKYSTIQAAVNAAHDGDRVLVDPGIYQEQVTISKSIELDGSSSCNGGQAIILAPTNLGTPTVVNPGALVHVTGNATNAEIGNLTIKGAANGTPNLLYGVRIDGGAYARIDFDTLANIIDSTNPILGVGISVGNASRSDDGLGAQVGSADIDFNTIANYQRGGVVVSNTGSWACVTGNSVSATLNNPSDSVAGIEVSDSASANVTWNSISGNTNGSDGCGVLLYKPGSTQIQANLISNNDYGVFGSLAIASNSGCSNNQVSISCNAITCNTYVGIEFDNSSGVSIDSNFLSHNGSDNTADGGIYLFQSTNNSITNNVSANNDGSGIYVDAGSTGNAIRNNVFSSNDNDPTNQNADAVDLSTGSGTAATANVWCGNQGGSYIDNSGQTLFQKFNFCQGSGGGGDHRKGHGNHSCFDQD